MKTIKLKRVPYGKTGTLDEDKEYTLADGAMFSPVGTLADWESKYPDYKIIVCDDKPKNRIINRDGLSVPACVSFGSGN